jgi:uncharacterized damage-inducible protein DinB
MPDATLTEIYRNWGEFQQMVVAVVRPLMAEQLALAVAPHQRTAAGITAHIIAARGYWLNHVLGMGGKEMASLRTWDDDGPPARSAAEFVRGLEASWQLLEQSVNGWSAADLTEPLMRLRRGEEFRFTRMWVIWHLIEHDLYHGGELSLTLGMHGVTGIDL